MNGKMVLPLYLELVREFLECYVPFWCKQLKKNFEKLESLQPEKTQELLKDWKTCLTVRDPGSKSVDF